MLRPTIPNIEITTAIGDAKQVMFDLALGATPSTDYWLQVFSSPFYNKANFGEGKQSFYSANVTTETNG